MAEVVVVEEDGTELDVVADRAIATGPLTASELARAVGLSAGGLSIALERLEQVGDVRRSPHPEDRRSVVVEATPAVEGVEAEVFGRLGRRMQRLIRGFSDDELRVIARYLEGVTGVTAQTVAELVSEK